MEWVKLAAIPAYYIDGALLRAGEAAEVLFCRGLAHCGGVESQGLIDKTVLPMLISTRAGARAAALVREGLWVDEGTHYRIRSWEKWQDEHDIAAQKRTADRERKRKERKRDAVAYGIELYRCYDENDELLYIGVTENVRMRMRQHEKESRWFSLCDYVSLEHCETVADGFEREKRAIAEESPPYNKDKGTKVGGWHARRVTGHTAETDGRSVTSQDASRDVTPLEVEGDVERENTEQLTTSVVAAQARPTKRGTRIPDEWPPDQATGDSLRSWAHDAAPAVDLRFETDNWHDWHRAKGDTAKDWSASWRTWMRRAQKDAERRSPGQLALGGSRQSTTDQRVTQGLALVEQFRQQEGA